MTNYLIVPGLGNSGPEHWQTYFESKGTNFIRVDQKEWEAPNCSDWTETIDTTVAMYRPETVVLVGHSLGCAAIAHWTKRYGKTIKGAFLVAPSDTEAPQYDFPATGFAPVPLERLPFVSMVVASANDVWVSFARARQFADGWGSMFVNLGDAGHINAASGHGPWEEGLTLLKRLG